MKKTIMTLALAGVAAAGIALASPAQAMPLSAQDICDTLDATLIQDGSARINALALMPLAFKVMGANNLSPHDAGYRIGVDVVTTCPRWQDEVSAAGDWMVENG